MNRVIHTGTHMGTHMGTIHSCTILFIIKGLARGIIPPIPCVIVQAVFLFCRRGKRIRSASIRMVPLGMSFCRRFLRRSDSGRLKYLARLYSTWPRTGPVYRLCMRGWKCFCFDSARPA